jgi:protein SCO1/2
MKPEIAVTRNSSRRSACLRVMLLALFLGLSGSLSAQLPNDIPEEEKGTGVDAREGQMISPDWTFHDEQNNFVRMGDYFDGKRPIVLSFNYSNCPKQCSAQLQNMALALRDVQLLVDQDFQVISVSIDSNEQASRAREMKAKFTNFYNKPERNGGWHFLIGDDKQIRGLAAECGVKYKYIPEQKLYSHPPVFLLVSPNGKIVRYIYGLEYEAKTIRQALIEATQGKIGSPINRVEFLIGCYMYNDSTGQYTFQAMSLMRLGGLMTVIALGVALVPYWFFRRQQRETVLQKTDTQLSPLKP